jgi:hypothetical protein
MADYLSVESTFQSAKKTLVGVDVSEFRMATCKKILHKYHIHPKASGVHECTDNKEDPENLRIRTYCCDGTSFYQTHSNNKLPKLVFDSLASLEEFSCCGKRKRMNKSARARERKRLKDRACVDFEITTTESDKNPSWTARPFDFVLVDAECSTDGSLKHIQRQMARESAQDVARKLTDNTKLKELVQLQKDLAGCGFRLLKEGGSMVYSTCSLSQDQNENVVAWLLEEFSDAFLMPVDFTAAVAQEGTSDSSRICAGEFGVRFYPNFDVRIESSSLDAKPGKNSHFYGGGFFLAKIGRKER